MGEMIRPEPYMVRPLGPEMIDKHRGGNIISYNSALDVRQVAAALDVSEWLVRKLISSGELRHVRIGRLIRVPHSELAGFLDRKIEESTRDKK